MKDRATVSIIFILGLLALGFIPALCEAAVPDTATGSLQVDREGYGGNDALNPFEETAEDLGEDPDKPPVGLQMAPAGAGNPLDSVSVGPMNGSWQAQLELTADADELRGTLNGQRVTHLFKKTLKGTQVVRLAPDDGLRFGRNVLKVAAVYQHRIYPTQTVEFAVDRTRPLASAGRDRQVRSLKLCSWTAATPCISRRMTRSSGASFGRHPDRRFPCCDPAPCNRNLRPI